MNEPKVVDAQAVDVTYLPDTPGAKKHPRGESVLVRKLPLRELYTFAELMSRRETPVLVALCVGREPAWVDELDDSSFGTLSEKAIALNFPRAVTLSEKDPALAAIVIPILRRMKLTAGLADGLLGLQSSAASSASLDGPGASASTTPPTSSSPSSATETAPTPSDSSKTSS